MNTDCTKPSVAPKPRFVCHASLKLPAPLISAVRSPRPSIAPKPKVGVEVNGRDHLFSGSKEGCINGSFPTSDGENEEERDNALHRLTAHGPRRRDVSEGLDGRDVTEEEKEDEVSQKMDEDWGLTDSALTEEVDSLETLWATAGSGDAVEMIDTDMTEDMDHDAGEALADADGLSMGDVFVNSVDEEAGCSSAELENGDTKKKLRVKETAGGSADDLTEDVLTSDTRRVLLTRAEEREEEAECGIPRDILESRRGHKVKEKERNTQTHLVTNEHMIRYDDLAPEDHLCDTHITLENSQTHEPYYIAAEDIINRDMIQTINKAHACALTPKRLLSLTTGGFLVRGRQTAGGTMSKQGPMRIGDGDEYSSNVSDDNEFRTRQETEEHGADAPCSRLSSQSRFGLACSSVSIPTSLSEDQLTPSNSDFLKDLDDLEGQFVAFMEDTTDTEQDISDEHVYEDPGLSSEGENVFPFTQRTPGARSCSLSQHRGHAGVPFFGRPCKGPALCSSPVLSSTRHKSYSKPQYLSLYPRSLSLEGQDSPLCVYRDSEGSPRQRGATSERFSRCSPLSSSGLSTPTSVVDIPPPFELAYITKKPITKSSPSLLIEGDSSEKNRKKKSSLKRFLMLKFRRKKDNKPSSFESSPESGLQTPAQILDMDRHSISSSPRLKSHSASKPQTSLEPASAFSVAFLNRSVIRVESFEDRSRVTFTPLPLTKPRSISFPNADTSDYENVPPIQSHYENLQVLQRRPVRPEPFRDFFERPTQGASSAGETDGYVDMSSLPGFQSRCRASEQEAESAYTEAYKVCSVATAPHAGSVGDVRGQTAAHEEQGRTSEEDDGGGDNNYDRRADGQSRAFYIAKELVDTEKLHVKALKHLQEDFRAAVGAAVGDEGEPVVDEERLWEILNELPDVYSLHRRILAELENRIQQWEDSQRIADVFLSRKAEFLVFTTYIGHYDRSMSMLEESCRTSPAFAAVVHRFERPAGTKVSLKHQLLQVIVRVAQYRMLLTDYLNNLSPDSQEYEDTQAAVVIVSDIAEQANDSLRHGENLLRLVNIEYSVRGQRDLLQPGRVFVKEGTLMKVSRKCRQPRHLFLMNDVLLYTYPQQDGKYRWKNTLALTGLKVSKPIMEDVQHALRIEGADISITLSASSFLEREDWFYTLSRTVTEHSRGSVGFSSSTAEARDRPQFSLGEKAPTLVPASQVMMCMNCTSDFSLTLRKHHCHGCGRIVCRSCSQNRYPLKYMKGRLAKVCDHCYNELKKRGEDVSGLSHKNSPRLTRSSRPLSAVFQNIHPPNIWRHRKGAMSFSQVTESDEGSISGSLHRSKKSKRSWKRLWFLLKDKVLYTYRAQEETVASESLPLLGFTVKLSDKQDGEEAASVFQLYHKNTLYYTFKAEDNHTAQRWVNAMEEATVL